MLGKVGRLAQIGTLPETRALLFSPATRRQVRVTARRLVHDRAELARDLVRSADVRAFAQGAIQHPVTHELTGVGLMFLPGRYLPIGWAAGWATRRVARRAARRASSAQPARGEAASLDDVPIEIGDLTRVDDR